MNQRPNHSRLHWACSRLPEDACVAPNELTRRPLHLIFHIPRCAGQTVHHHLTQHVSSERYFRVPKRRGLGRLVLSKYQIGDMPSPQKLDVVGGHWVGRSIERNFPGRPIVRSILLRDPVSQFLSHYNYRMMRYLSQGLRPYAVDIAYRSRRPDFLTHFILNTFAEIPRPRLVLMSSAEKFAQANRFLSSFAFVGDHTRCDELIARLAGDLGMPERASLRNTSDQWLERVSWKPLGEGDLSPSMIASIRRDNELDQILWETWRDAGDGPIEPVPHEFAQEAQTRRLTRHASRLVNQVRRRVDRRWTGTDASLGNS